jgi:hypothetical protein
MKPAGPQWMGDLNRLQPGRRFKRAQRLVGMLALCGSAGPTAGGSLRVVGFWVFALLLLTSNRQSIMKDSEDIYAQ